MRFKLVKRETRYNGQTPYPHTECFGEIQGKLEINERSLNDGFTHSLFVPNFDLKLFTLNANYVWLEFMLPDETDIRVEFIIKRTLIELAGQFTKPGVRLFLEQRGTPAMFVGTML